MGGGRGDDAAGCAPERPTLRFVRAPSLVDHALHALVVLAAAPQGTSLKIRELCAPQGLSRKFVAAALNDLRLAEVVGSRRGSNGGYWLARPAHEITVADVFDAVDVRTPTEAPGFDGTLDVWVRAERAVRSGFSAVTIADLASR
ncbi:MAG TPA: Rrf2 family transcriptional regulator [Acidimicrobiales bacterium]|nr:Rrf2 family transcriptional regulator [Acidimicrobiales bacterium]